MDNLKALLIQRRRHREPNLLNEFEALARTAGYDIIGIRDIVSPPSAKFGLGSGKVEEIATWIEINTPDVVLFSPKLRSSQVFRLMEVWDTEVRDRTQLVLEIFDRHAKTPQAKLQIEQARLSYELPFERFQIRQRLQKEQTGDRPTTNQVGVGEDLLNLRIQAIRRRISAIQQKLEKISEVQQLKKQKRAKEGFLEIALAGYTNAGKSTLHSALTGSNVTIADQLFTTLSTKAAELSIPGRQIILSDSVGFISDLPKSLYQAFNTTLMEIGDADVIILVVDGSDSPSEMLRKLHACYETFTEVGINGIPLVVALNKVDLLEEDDIAERIRLLEDEGQHAVPISAKESINLTELLKNVDALLPALRRYILELPYDDGSMSLLSWLYEVGQIHEQEYKEDMIRIQVTLSFETAEKVRRAMQDGSLHLEPIA
ncbi:MAG: GTPase HflX [Candidatus Thorarchaeota archaeon]|nr:GTPase HflX [Candidatus Thorarchaeota archaeon]